MIHCKINQWNHQVRHHLICVKFLPLFFSWNLLDSFAKLCDDLRKRCLNVTEFNTSFSRTNFLLVYNGCNHNMKTMWVCSNSQALTQLYSFLNEFRKVCKRNCWTCNLCGRWIYSRKKSYFYLSTIEMKTLRCCRSCLVRPVGQWREAELGWP